MPDVQNVFRRGGAYWWRRTLSWWDGNAQPITLALSLGTKDLGVARHRAAAMTAQSEVVRMTLYDRVARDGLTVAQRDAVFRTEMRAYRDALEHLSAEWQFKPAWAKVTDVDADLQIYEAIWGAFARTGVIDGVPSMAYADEQFGELTEGQRAAARRLVGSIDLRHKQGADKALARAVAINPDSVRTANNLDLARMALAGDLPRQATGEVAAIYAARLNDAGVAARLRGEEARARAAFAQAIEASGRWYARVSANLAQVEARE